MDKISLSRIDFYGYHGVYPEENKLGQRYTVDLDLYFPLNVPGRSDALEDTVNYAEVYGLLKQIVEGSPFKLIEALAERIASEVLHTYTKVNTVTVRVTKPNPPFAIHFQGVTVDITRSREAHQ
jgi:dihydroneopterin aldolase